jgi:antagonist of KipI
VPASGFADSFSAGRANALAGNDADSALLEAALGALEIEATESLAFGVAGAAAEVRVNGAPADRGRPLVLGAGDRLGIGPVTAGLRVYVAVAGGIDVPRVLGSRSALVPSALGGFAGRTLSAGDEVPSGPATASSASPASAFEGPDEPPFGSGAVRALPGPQWDLFPPEARRRFFGEAFRVSSRSDRRGVRLEGAGVSPSAGEIDPEGVVVGSVQVPAGGEPIVLMPDGPVTGGYPKIAVVIRADLPLLGQLRPGEMLRFREVSRTEALSADAGRRRAERPA